MSNPKAETKTIKQLITTEFDYNQFKAADDQGRAVNVVLYLSGKVLMVVRHSDGTTTAVNVDWSQFHAMMVAAVQSVKEQP